MSETVTARLSKQTGEQSNDQKQATKEERNALDITLASQAEDPPEEGDIEDAFAAQGHEVEDDGDEQSEDAKGAAAAEQEMDSELMETVGLEDRESMKELEGKQDEGALESFAVRPEENQGAERKAGKTEVEGDPAAEAKSPAKSSAKPSAKSLVYEKKKSTKVVKQRPRRRF